MFRTQPPLLCIALVLSAGLGATYGRELSFEERVRAQEAIERVYYSHQKEAARPFEEAVPRQLLEHKVHEYLKQSTALALLWRRPVTADVLEQEAVRIFTNTRFAGRLAEIDAALNYDRFVFEECLARQRYVDREVRRLFSMDASIHAASRREAEELHSSLSSRVRDPREDDPRRTVVVFDGVAETEAVLTEGPAERLHRTMDVDRFRALRDQLPRSVGEIGDLVEDRETFSFRVLLEDGGDRLVVATFAVPKRTYDSWWHELESNLDDRAASAISKTSGRTLPSTKTRHDAEAPGTDPCPVNHWNGMTDVLNPSARMDGTAVWTGTEMIVWGGYDALHGFGDNSGGRYDPLTDTWTPTSRMNAPEARFHHTAVWTGNEMIVWGGWFSGVSHDLQTGARYDPISDSWTATSLVNAPTGRQQHTAIWTEAEMIVWGGVRDGFLLTTGGRYDPVKDTWVAISAVNAPAARFKHAAVWTGTSMLVWGGKGDAASCFNGGGRYDLGTDTWSPMSTVGAATQCDPMGLWTGSEMLVMNDLNDPNERGGRYDPASDAWRSIARLDFFTRVAARSIVWTGRRALIWGGRYPSGTFAGGVQYDPGTDQWLSAWVPGGLSPRADVYAVWADGQLLLWGGWGASPNPDYTEAFDDGNSFIPDESPDDDRDGVTVCQKDCNDANPFVWYPPWEARLTVQRGGAGETRLLIGAYDGLGYETVADLVTGSILPSPADAFASSVCLENDPNSGPVVDNRPGPAAGSAVWYLTAVRNSCGSTGFGTPLRDALLEACP